MSVPLAAHQLKEHRHVSPLISRFATAVSLRLGHAVALTCPRQVIHSRGVASLPQGKPRPSFVPAAADLPSPWGRWQPPSHGRRLTDEGDHCQALCL